MNNLEILPIGGLGEVGMNCMLIGVNGRHIVVDCGTMANQTSWLGFSNIIPNIEILESYKDSIEAVIITHGHEDHIGALPYLLKNLYIPKIFMSKLTHSLFKEKLKDADYNFSLEVCEFEKNTLYATDSFKFEFFDITHSYIESYFTRIETPLGDIVHSGDFKIDKRPYNKIETNYKALEQIGKKSCFLLLSDSTNSEKKGWSMGELDIQNNLIKEINSTKGKVFVTSFASNIQRTQQILDVLVGAQKKIVAHGLSFHRFLELGRLHGYITAPESNFIRADEISHYNSNEVAILTSGSQGEMRSGLVRIANDLDGNIKIESGDKVIFSALKIPGNEINIRYLINAIQKRGGTVVHGAEANVHTSGHAYAEEQQYLASQLSPKYFIPIHGDYSMLSQHIENVQAVLPEVESMLLLDGDKAVYSNETWSIEKEFANCTKRWQQSGNNGFLNGEEVKFRKRVALGGMVVIKLVLQKNQILSKPEIEFYGLYLNDEAKIEAENQLVRKLQYWVDDFYSLNRSMEYNIENYIKDNTRKFFRRFGMPKPETLVFMV